MATFADVGKDINDQFTRDIATDKVFEVNTKYNQYVSILLKSKVLGDKNVSGSITPTIKYPDWGLELKPELGNKDKDQKSVKVDLSFTDVFTKGLKIEASYQDGKKEETSAGFVYKNEKFGGFTFKYGSAADSYVSPSLYINTPDTKGFGIGGTAKLVLGDEVDAQTWKAAASYKKDKVYCFGGVEQKYEDKTIVGEDKKEETVKVKNVYLIGGFSKQCCDTVTFGGQGSVHTGTYDVDADIFYKKVYTEGFIKFRVNPVKRTAGVSRQFQFNGLKATLGSSVTFCGEKAGEGNFGFQLTTDL